MDLISSRNNPRIKSVRALQRTKARRQSGLFLVEGIRHVGEAIQANAPVEAIYYAPDLLDSQFAINLVQKASQDGVQSYAISAPVFNSLALKDNPQGILAVVRQLERPLDQLKPNKFSWGVALVSPQDPGNVGAVLRTIDAVAASGLLVLENSVDIYHPAVVRASMGAIFWQPIVRASFDQFAAWAKEHYYQIYGASAHAELEYNQVAAYQQPCILLMGSERQGLTADQTAICQQIIRLPMHGQTTSLNLAVATGVLLYDMLAKLA